MPKRQDEENIFIKTLEWICGKLESAKIPYMITGGSALGFWGHIRTTMDIDIVIQIQHSQVKPFLNSIKNEAYVDTKEATNAISSKRMFNVIHNETCFKVDIIPLNNTPFENEKFKRKIKVKLANGTTYTASPEDLILSKLLWSKSAGGSERQFKDCESILKINHGSLDMNYINKWSQELGIDVEFKKLSI